MSNILVTLVSEQAIPNVQYIKEFQPSDAYLFISTPAMEKKNKSQNIIDACGLEPNIVKIITVNEEDFSDIQNNISEALKTPLFDDADKIIVNCTLGTKVMSIALFDYFRENSKAIILYSPINTNKYKTITGLPFERGFLQKITIDEYLKSYGIGIKKKGSVSYSFEIANQIFSHFLELTDEEFEVLSLIRERERVDEKGKLVKVIGREKGVKNIDEIKGLSDFLRKISFGTSLPNQLSKYEVMYLTGGWFEEWCYYKVKNNLQLDESQIAIGLESVIEAGNDLDVVFIYNNDLYIIECKTLLSKDLQQITLYKSGALVDKFGRSAKSYLFTLSDNLRSGEKLIEAIDLRARQQNVTVLDRFELVNNFDSFFEQIRK